MDTYMHIYMCVCAYICVCVYASVLFYYENQMRVGHKLFVLQENISNH